MADRAVVAVFDTQNQAYDAAADLQRLGEEGVIQIKRGAIVTKDDEGNLTIPDTKMGGPWGLLGGGLLGGLLGALLGPAGAAAGAAAGTAAVAGAAIGASADLRTLGVGNEFILAVSADLKPGHTALLAEVGEGATEPVDAAVRRHQGRVHRQDLP
jgi:uncharacterized membrane protein